MVDLPIEVQQMIADGMGVPLEKVYGVATFYAQFALSPQRGDTTSPSAWARPAMLKGRATSSIKSAKSWESVRTECTDDGKALPDGLPLHRRLRFGPP